MAGRLVRGQPLDRTENQNEAVFLRQGVDRILEQPYDLVIRRRAFRIRRRPSEALRPPVPLSQTPPPVAPGARPGLVESDATDPCGEARWLGELVEIREGSEPRLLHDVLGIAIVAKHRPCDAIEPPIVSAQELLEQIALAFGNAPHDLVVGKVEFSFVKNVFLLAAHRRETPRGSLRMQEGCFTPRP